MSKIKFVKKTTGETHKSIENVRVAYCDSNHGDCVSCPVSFHNNPEILYCALFCQKHPKESAQLMGYDAIQDQNKKSRKEV